MGVSETETRLKNVSDWRRFPNLRLSFFLLCSRGVVACASRRKRLTTTIRLYCCQQVRASQSNGQHRPLSLSANSSTVGRSSRAEFSRRKIVRKSAERQRNTNNAKYKKKMRQRRKKGEAFFGFTERKISILNISEIIHHSL